MASVGYGTKYKLKGKWVTTDEFSAEWSGEPTCIEVDDPAAPKVSFKTAGEDYYPQIMYSWHEDQLNWEIEDEIFTLHVLSGPGKLEFPYQKYVTIENKNTTAIKRYKLVEITEEEYEETRVWYKSVKDKIRCEDSQWENLPTKDRINNVDPAALPADKDGFIKHGTSLYGYDESIGGPVVHIPEGIKRIKAKAFAECQGITQVYIPDSVRSIGDGCFTKCRNLVSVRLPEGLAEICDDVFNSCERLQEINIPGTVTSIGNKSFADCKSLEEAVMPEALTYLGDRAFEGAKSLKKITLNGSLKEIEFAAFYVCAALEELHIPASVTKIGPDVFRGCTGLQRIIVADDNEIYCSQNNCLIHRANKTLVLACNDSVIPDDGSVDRIGEGAFSNCEKIQSIILPEIMQSIGHRAFSGCHALKHIQLPRLLLKGNTYHSRRAYGDNLFRDCSSLEHFEIPTWMTELSSGMFRNCKSLKEIKIPATVTTIDSWAFSGCKSLTELIIPKSVTHIGTEKMFGGGNGNFIQGCSSLKNLKVELGNPVYYSKDNCIIETKTGALFAILENGVIPDDGSVTKIGRNAFCACEHITEISLPEGITEIGEDAFSKVRNLKKIHIPKSVNNIEFGAFFDSHRENKHDAVEEENGVWYVGTWAIGVAKEKEEGTTSADSSIPYYSYFVWKNALDELGAITIREGTVGICASAFFGSGVTSVSLPDSLRYICDNAFSSCEYLKAITIPENVEKIGDCAFAECKNLEQVVLQEGLIRIGEGSFNCCEKLQSVTIPRTVQAIDSDAFRLCKGLQSLTIPSGEIEIGRDAFGFCGDIPSVDVPEYILAQLTHFGSIDDEDDGADVEVSGNCDGELAFSDDDNDLPF